MDMSSNTANFQLCLQQLLSLQAEPEREKFLEDFDDVMEEFEKRPKDTLVFTGDFNASLGVRDEDDHNGVLGPCGIRHVSETGRELYATLPNDPTQRGCIRRRGSCTNSTTCL